MVKVVECLSNCTTNGFRLLDVRRVVHTGATTSGTVTAGASWTDLTRTMLVGGFNGAGCTTTETAAANTKVCHARIFPSGTNTINWTRDAGGATLSAATSTVMAVQWGTAWTVQRVQVQGTNGGDGVNATDEYNTAAISPVTRANTWVWGTGHTNDNGIGDAAEGCVITLGNGVAQNATESTVAVGLEYSQTINFEVYALTHPNLATSYVFKADGNSAESDGRRHGAERHRAQRMALVTNGQNGTGNQYPRPMFSSRYYTNNTTVRLERRRSGDRFPRLGAGHQLQRHPGDRHAPERRRATEPDHPRRWLLDRPRGHHDRHLPGRGQRPASCRYHPNREHRDALHHPATGALRGVGDRRRGAGRGRDRVRQRRVRASRTDGHLRPRRPEHRRRATTPTPSP